MCLFEQNIASCAIDKLAIFISQYREYKSLFSHLTTYYTCTIILPDKIFIGLYEKNVDWVWIETDTVTNFNDFGPGDLENEQCIALFRTFDFQWIDTTCYNTLEMLCEFSIVQ